MLEKVKFAVLSLYKKTPQKASQKQDEEYTFLTPRQLIWRKFIRNRLALVRGSCTPARGSLLHLRDHRQAGLSDPSCPRASARLANAGQRPYKEPSRH